MKCFLDVDSLSVFQKRVLITWIIKMLPHSGGNGFTPMSHPEQWAVYQYIGVEYDGSQLNVTHDENTGYYHQWHFFKLTLDAFIQHVLSGTLLEQPAKEIVLNKEYTAVVSAKEVKVGCQTFDAQIIKQIAKTIEELEKSAT